MLKTSVIIPVYNEEHYLPLLLDSLLKQTTPPNEIIICDNNSTDNSLKVINSYLDKYPIKLIHQKIKGITPTVEKTWRLADGDLIIRTDADAILPSNYIQNCLNYYHSHTDIHATTGPMLSAETHPIYSVLYPLGTGIFNYLLSLIRGYPQILGPNTVVRQSTLKNINGYQSLEKSIDDHILTKKLHNHNYQIAYVFSQYNYHSVRRWLKSPLNIIKSLLININSNLYQEKK